MSLWREALNGSLVEAFVAEDDAKPYPREPSRRSPDGPGTDPPAPVATCASCRRSVTPRRGVLGPECSVCGAYLPKVKLPPAHRRSPTSSPPADTASVMAEVAEQLLTEASEVVTSVRHLAHLRITADSAIAAASDQDRARARRRESAQHWRAFAGSIGL